MVKPVPRTLVLARSDVDALLDVERCIEAVEHAFRTRAAGARSGILGMRSERGGFHLKAALMPEANGGGYFAAKLNANFPANPRVHGIPTIQGVLALFDASTGELLAVMDSIAITILRTAAATAVAARHLAPPDGDTATIVGCGAQAVAQLAALHVVRPLQRVYAVDLDRTVAMTFADVASARLGVPVVVADDLATATRASQMVITCTTARTPFLDPDHVEPGTFIAAVGADSESKGEISPTLMARSAVVVDDLDQCATIGDLHHAIEAGAMRIEDVRADLAAVTANPGRGRRSADEMIVFDSTGVGLQDVAAARVVYERAVARRRDFVEVSLGS